MTDAELRRRQAASQRGWYRALGSGSPGARVVDVEGTQATIVPVRPWFSVFNGVLYEDVASLERALPELDREYREAGVKAWAVWVPPGDEAAAKLLEREGFAGNSTPLLMAAHMDDVDIDTTAELDLVADPSWDLIGRINDAAHGVLEDWSMAAVFERMNDAASRLYAVRRNGDPAAGLVARESADDCYLWFVATAPDAQRLGLGADLMRHALRQARSRGCETTTLESTAAGERLYERLGYRDLGRYTTWERREST